MSKENTSFIGGAWRLGKACIGLGIDRINLERAKIDRIANPVTLSARKAAQRNRKTADWNPSNQSGNSGYLPTASTLIPRARQMVQDDPNAASIKRAFRREVVGTGITAKSTAKKPNGDLNELFNKKADENFKIWAEDPTLCDLERRRTFAQIQSWAIGEMVEVGEALVIKSYIPRREVSGLVLQLVESEQLDMDILEHDGREVIGGVEVDEFGAAVAYHIHPRHPNDIRGYHSSPWHRSDIRTPGQRDTRTQDEKGHRSQLFDSVRVEADRVCHIYDPERVRQVRGITRLSPSLQYMRDAGEFHDATVQAARAGANIGLVIKTATPTPTGEPPLKDGSATGQDEFGNDELSQQAMMVARIQENEDVFGFTPTQPGGQYKDFTNIQDRKIAAGVGVSASHMTRKVEGNFSAARQEMLTDWREFEPLEKLITSCLCTPVRNEFIFWSVFEGSLIAPGYTENQRRFNSADWRGQGHEWIDPKKQADGLAAMIKLGLADEITEANKIGRDYNDIHANRMLVLEKRLEHAKKLAEVEAAENPTLDVPPTPGAPAPTPERQPQESIA